MNAIGQSLAAELSESRFAEYQELVDYIKQLLEFLNIGIAEKRHVSDVGKALKDNLRLFEKELHDESEVKLEILFMPYKASMWDSLESVWLAADRDPGCNAYVVPIPYFDRNADGSLGQRHYEGPLMPSYVPRVYYEDCDLEKWRPDIIYIHNPYDECNLVTSVDPRFYSQELKKYTDTLVYIPYFLVSGYNTLEDAISFSAPPAIRNVDYIIYQSVTQLEALKEAGLYHDNALVLGNPKFDSILNMDTHPYRPCLEKTETGRKTFLFSTTLWVLLSRSDPMVWMDEVLIPIFDIVLAEENADLIWRPHPLTEATIQSMRPAAKERYDSVVEKYSRSARFHIDRDPDYRNSFQKSDAMICDGGSLTYAYAVTGKPVISYTDRKEEKKYPICDLPGIYYCQSINLEYECYKRYGASWTTEIIRDFCRAVLNDALPTTREQRLERMRGSIVNGDGTAGEKIHLEILKRAGAPKK